jgi:acetyl esterase/lipase
LKTRADAINIYIHHQPSRSCLEHTMSRILRTGLALGISLCGLLITTHSAADKPAGAKPGIDKPVAGPTAKPTATAEKPKPPVDPPTLADIPYGPHPKQVLDFYRAESNEPTPVVLYIHGGGWRAGSKNAFGAKTYLAAGISVVSVEYRFVQEAGDVTPPVKAPLHDAARALQFVRSKAAEWNLDKTRIAATGGSAGACSSLWLAFHDDLADPQSADPVARESTRLLCAAVVGAQTSLDPQQIREWMPNGSYGAHAFYPSGGDKKSTSFATFLEEREKLLPWIREYSPYALVTADDPPVALFYGGPPAMGQETKDPTHSANYGLPLQEKCKILGVDCALIYPQAPGDKPTTVHGYLIEKLKGKQ